MGKNRKFFVVGFSFFFLVAFSLFPIMFSSLSETYLNRDAFFFQLLESLIHVKFQSFRNELNTKRPIRHDQIFPQISIFIDGVFFESIVREFLRIYF